MEFIKNSGNFENLSSFYKNNYQSFNLPEFARGNEFIQRNTYNNAETILKNDEDYFEKDNNILNFSRNNNQSDLKSENDEKELYFTKTKFKTDPKKIFEITKVKKIFMIQKNEKNKRKKGRLPLDKHHLYKPKHNKKSTDNIIIKIKRYFVKRTMKYINKKYNQFLSKTKQNKRPFLKRIIPRYYKVYTLEENQKFLNLSLEQLFSEDLSIRIKEYPKDYNRNNIKSIFEKNEAKEVIEILKKTVRKMYEIYVCNKIPDYNLESDLNDIVKDKNIEEKGKDTEDEKEKIEYKNKIKNIAENLIESLYKKVKKSNI